MSRGNVFKLSGNLALGGGSDTYSTNELQSIKSSLRLLKARQSQKKSEQNIDMNNNYGISYSSNTNQRSQMKSNNKDYNYYQNSAKNHVPISSYDNNNYGGGYQQEYNNKATSRNSLYDNNQRNQQNTNKNTNLSIPKNDQINTNSKNNYNQYQYNQPTSLKQQSVRNPLKNRTEQPKLSNDYDNYNTKPLNKNQQDIKINPQTRPPLRKQQLNQQTQSYNPPTQIQEPTIKQANRQNKQEIVEYDPSTFVQCTVGCGRKFNPDSISKHQAICYKVFQKKRKAFNAQEQRILDEQHKNIVKNVVAEEKKAKAPTNKKQNAKSDKDNEKMTKWKAQSLAFRSMLKDNKGEEMSAEQKQKMDEIKNIGMIKCPHCARTFNETAGPKHITFCQTQSRKNKMKR